MSEAKPGKARRQITQAIFLSAEQMRGAGHIEPEAVFPIDCNMRRVARRPICEAGKQAGVCIGVDFACREIRHEGARVSQTHAGLYTGGLCYGIRGCDPHTSRFDRDQRERPRDCVCLTVLKRRGE